MARTVAGHDDRPRQYLAPQFHSTESPCIAQRNDGRATFGSRIFADFGITRITLHLHHRYVFRMRLSLGEHGGIAPTHLLYLSADTVASSLLLFFLRELCTLCVVCVLCTLRPSCAAQSV